MKVEHIVLDLETLGTSHTAVILSVGMVFIHDDQIIDRYRINIDSSDQETLYNRTTDEDTLKWWRVQLQSDEGKLAWQMALEDAKSPTQAAMRITAMLNSCEGEPLIWGNSNTFDNEILRSFLIELKQPVWSFRRDRDFRTLKALFKEKVPEPPFLGTRHVAIDDAMNEAYHLIQILKYIKAH